MPPVRGRAEVKQYMASLPEQLTGVLRGAAKAGAKVIADEIKEQTPSEEVRDNLRTRSRKADGRIVVMIDVKPGWARSVGTWLEWGTAPHLISVDESQREGRTVARINKLAKDAGGHSLVINGKFVGSTVTHPGAQAHPTFRPALDLKGADAVKAAQSYISSRIARGRIVGTNEPEGDGE